MVTEHSTGPLSPNNGTTQEGGSINKRSNKPIMEKRRRARINNSLNELKTLILDAMKKDPARHSKLEKADILEMTVKHLQTLQRQQAAISTATDPSVMNKFRAGFSECAQEVGRFPGLDPIVKRKLLQHLTNCLNQVYKPPEARVQVHIVANPAESSPRGDLQLLPTRLPNGHIALVLPTEGTDFSSLPVLMPFAKPDSSGSSVSGSNDSGSSYSGSPEPDSGYEIQARPLALVVKRCEEGEEEKPWRPW